MSQVKTNQVSPAYNNSNDVETGTSSIQQDPPPGNIETIHNTPYQLQFPTPPNPEEDGTGNPCSCCFPDITITAKILVIFNLVFLSLKFVWYVIVKANIRSTRTDLKSELLVVPYVAPYFCGGFNKGHDFILFMDTCFIVIWVADVIISSAFLATVLSIPKFKYQIRICNVFRWFNFCHPGSLLYLILLIAAAIERVCLTEPHFYVAVFVGTPMLAIWISYNGRVARAFRNKLQRGKTLPEQVQVAEMPETVKEVETSGALKI